MKTSEHLKELPAALLKAQSAIRFASKDAVNPYFDSRYADLGTVIETIKPALNNNGIVYLQTASPSSDGLLHLTTRLMHASGEWIEDTMTMPLPKRDPQGYGSAMTYARRYSLAAITGLYQADDDGNAASHGGAHEPTEGELTEQLLDAAAEAAGKGVGAYKKFWSSLTPQEKHLIGEKRHADFKVMAEEMAAQA